ncbi:MAG TPA: ABC transporter permease [Phototrophicaceae bacterium]|nr:ABC transporter permease [Phototrophicaceae bacterium]
MEITTQDSAPKPRPQPRRVSDIWKPHARIPRRLYTGTVIASLLLLLLIWSILSYGGFVHPSYFLPTPTAVVTAAANMLQTGELWENAQASLEVVIVGWIVAVLLAVPLGILMGSLEFFEALFEPIVDFVRYLPVSAMIPLLILYVGIGVEEKIAVIFIGTFFQLILLVADVAAHVANDLLDSAYTLGASRFRVFTTILLPATLPGVMDALRITLGWSWTYLIVAELVAAQHGLGFMIMTSERGLHTDRIFVGLVTIGLLGFASDLLVKWLHRRLLPWSPRLR